MADGLRTLSNAFKKSRSIMSTCSPFASFRAISSIVMTSCVSHDRFERKPCWLSHNMGGTIRTHWYADDLLKQCPSKGDKYVIDEELQHTDHLLLGVACFTFMNFAILHQNF
jgi:hypothetical protein